jgi:hypothetical protein
MNVDQIYQFQRDDAFADQFSADTYATFVAMPFSNRGGYPEPRIWKMLLKEVYLRANALLGATAGKRTFAPLKRVDSSGPGGAVVITDDIVTGILKSHFVVGDLTGCNFGVVLEAGIALALKPSSRVLLFTQDDTASLHFDLKVTNINRYKEDDLVEKVAMSLVSAAAAFETEADRYIRLVSSQLTPDAIMLLNLYAQMWRDLPNDSNHPSIFAEKAAGHIPHFTGAGGRVAFHDCVRELSARRLMWTDFHPNTPPGSGRDSYGIHATKLGWRAIENLWKHDATMLMPPDAPTGPREASRHM